MPSLKDLDHDLLRESMICPVYAKFYGKDWELLSSKRAWQTEAGYEYICHVWFCFRMSTREDSYYVQPIKYVNAREAAVLSVEGHRLWRCGSAMQRQAMIYCTE